jgi:hypothetical protein
MFTPKSDRLLETECKKFARESREWPQILGRVGCPSRPEFQALLRHYGISIPHDKASRCGAGAGQREKVVGFLTSSNHRFLSLNHWSGFWGPPQSSDHLSIPQKDKNRPEL